MKINSDFNPNSSTVTLTVESRLATKYFANFRGMILGCKTVSGLEVNQGEGNKVTISFPLPKDAEQKRVSDTTMVVSLDATKMAGLNEIIKKFSTIALRKELSNVEFVPLTGYPYTKLCKEIKDAVMDHRNILFIKDYDEYLDCTKNNKHEYHQFEVKYGTQEYADCVLMIWKKQKSKINKLYSDKLTYTEWI